MHVHIEVDDHGHHVAARRPRRGGEQVLQRRRPATRPRQRRRVLPRAQDGGGRLHRRRRDAARPCRRLERRDRRGRRAQQRRAHPVRLGRPARKPTPSTMRAASSRRAACAASSSTRPCRASTRATRRTTRCTRRSRMPASRRSSTPARPASAPGLPGGRGLRLGLSNPMLLDPVAADFPDLQIIMAHPSVPWQDEALSVATHKHNTWIDLSGWSPKYFPAEARALRQLAPEDPGAVRLRLPAAHPDRWIRDAEQTALKPEVMPGILKHNAARLLGLDRAAPTTATQGGTHDHHRRLRRHRRSRRHRPRIHRAGSRSRRTA